MRSDIQNYMDTEVSKPTAKKNEAFKNRIK
jgi:hypothetical protein